MQLTTERKEQYIHRGGVSCPHCGSPDIEGGFVEIDAGRASQPVRCNACSERWIDLYELRDVVEQEPAPLAESKSNSPS